MTGGIAGKGPGQVGGHTRRTDHDTKAIGAGGAGKLRRLGGGAVGAENVGLIGDAELL